MWASSFIYLAMLDFLHMLSGGDIVLAYNLIAALLLMVYLPLMVICLQRFIHNYWIAFSIGLISSFTSSFAVTSAYWGVTRDLEKWSIVPQNLYTPFCVLATLLAYQYWFKPGATKRRIVPWHIIGLSALIGLSVYLIHAITSIGFSELIIGFSLFQVIRRRLPLWSFVLFIVSITPWLAFRIVFGSGVPQHVSALDVQSVLRAGQQSIMVFPWIETWKYLLLTSSVDELSRASTIFFAVYASITALSLLACAFSNRWRQLAKYLFVAIQVVYCFLCVHIV